MPDTISVDVPAMSAEQFQDAVIKAAARQLLQHYSYDEDGDPHTVPTALERRLREHMTTVLEAQAAKFAPIVAQSILDEGVPSVNSWGDATGPMRPLKTVIAEKVRSELYNGNTGKRGGGVLDQLISAEVQKQLRKDLQEVVAQARQPIIDAMREEATGVFERAMKKAVDIPL